MLAHHPLRLAIHLHRVVLVLLPDLLQLRLDLGHLLLLIHHHRLVLAVDGVQDRLHEHGQEDDRHAPRRADRLEERQENEEELHQPAEVLAVIDHLGVAERRVLILRQELAILRADEHLVAVHLSLDGAATHPDLDRSLLDRLVVDLLERRLPQDRLPRAVIPAVERTDEDREVRALHPRPEHALLVDVLVRRRDLLEIVDRAVGHVAELLILRLAVRDDRLVRVARSLLASDPLRTEQAILLVEIPRTDERERHLQEVTALGEADGLFDPLRIGRRGVADVVREDHLVRALRDDTPGPISRPAVLGARDQKIDRQAGARLEIGGDHPHRRLEVVLQVAR